MGLTRAWHEPSSPHHRPHATGPGGYLRSVTEALDLEGAEGEVKPWPTSTPPACFPASREFALLWDLREASLCVPHPTGMGLITCLRPQEPPWRKKHFGSCR